MNSKENDNSLQRTQVRAEPFHYLTVLHVTGSGINEWFSVSSEWRLVRTVGCVCASIRKNVGVSDFLDKHFSNRDQMTPEQFDYYVAQRMEKPFCHIDAYDIDFDNGLFSALLPPKGWRRSTMEHLCKAINFGDKKSNNGRM